MNEHKIEQDSIGEVRLPKDAYCGAQTQRAIENFPVSGIVFSPVFIRSLEIIKHACASVNRDFHLLESSIADAIIRSSDEVGEGKFDDQFPIDMLASN